MEYLSVAEARALPGLRLVLTGGVPGPWGEAAKALFHHHQVKYLPVLQVGGADNQELLDWTRHRNAPIAIYGDEPPRVKWLEILELAERLGNGPSLLPADREERIYALGLVNEIAGEHGFAWLCRQLIFDTMYERMGAAAAESPMFKQYRYDPALTKQAKEEALAFLAYLAERMHGKGRRYLAGDQLSVADIYWAYVSNMLLPLAPEYLPMTPDRRATYEIPGHHLTGYDPIVIEHRDNIFRQHLQLPLDF